MASRTIWKVYGWLVPLPPEMGVVVLSVDAEPTTTSGSVEAYEQGRQRLLELVDERGLPATWTVTRRSLTDTGSADELLHRVRDTETDHELACQPFVPNTRYDRKSARDAATACVHAAADHGVALTTATFADDRPRNRGALAECGFCCYRGPRPDHNTVGRVRRLARVVRRDAPPLVYPDVDEYGLVVVPTSVTPFRGALGLDSRLDELTIDRLLAGIDAAAENDGALHVRLSAAVVIDGPARDRLRIVLDRIADRRDEGTIGVETIHGVATWVHGHAVGQSIDTPIR